MTRLISPVLRDVVVGDLQGLQIAFEVGDPLFRSHHAAPLAGNWLTVRRSSLAASLLCLEFSKQGFSPFLIAFEPGTQGFDAARALIEANSIADVLQL